MSNHVQPGSEYYQVASGSPSDMWSREIRQTQQLNSKPTSVIPNCPEPFHTVEGPEQPHMSDLVLLLPFPIP
jgi:Golgi nucleoside diphosphatase